MKKSRYRKRVWIIPIALFVLLFGMLFSELSPLFYPDVSTALGIQNWIRNPLACEEGKVSCLINKKILDQKIKAGLQPWAKEQIQRDLAKFKPFKKSELDRFHHKLDMLFRFQVQDQQLKIFYKDNLNALPSYKVLADLFEYLVQNGYVNDTDFLMGLGDNFSSPIKPTLPIFVFAKDLDDPRERDEVLVPDWMNMLQMPSLQPRIREANRQLPWNQKDPLLFWRGGSASSTNFRQTLVDMSKKYPERIDAKFVDRVNVKFVKEEDHLKYKYLIAIDGGRATWTRFVWHLQSNSLTFKHESQQVQWFYKGIEPYVHYIPVKDEKALADALDWIEKNPQFIQDIVKQSTDFVENNLSLEDMVHYYIVLLQEYTKKVDLNA